MRLFTPQEANDALPLVRPLVERVVRRRRELQSVERRLEVVRASVSGNGGSLDPARVTDLNEQAARLAAELARPRRRDPRPRGPGEGPRRRSDRLSGSPPPLRGDGLPLLAARRGRGRALARPGRGLRGQEAAPVLENSPPWTSGSSAQSSRASSCSRRWSLARFVDRWIERRLELRPEIAHSLPGPSPQRRRVRRRGRRPERAARHPAGAGGRRGPSSPPRRSSRSCSAWRPRPPSRTWSPASWSPSPSRSGWATASTVGERDRNGERDRAHVHGHPRRGRVALLRAEREAGLRYHQERHDRERGASGRRVASPCRSRRTSTRCSQYSSKRRAAPRKPCREREPTATVSQLEASGAVVTVEAWARSAARADTLATRAAHSAERPAAPGRGLLVHPQRASAERRTAGTATATATATTATAGTDTCPLRTTATGDAVGSSGGATGPARAGSSSWPSSWPCSAAAAVAVGAAFTGVRRPSARAARSARSGRSRSARTRSSTPPTARSSAPSRRRRTASR